MDKTIVFKNGELVSTFEYSIEMNEAPNLLKKLFEEKDFKIIDHWYKIILKSGNDVYKISGVKTY